jgi:hypothetical protein
MAVVLNNFPIKFLLYFPIYIKIGLHLCAAVSAGSCNKFENRSVFINVSNRQGSVHRIYVCHGKENGELEAFKINAGGKVIDLSDEETIRGLFRALSDKLPG